MRITMGMVSRQYKSNLNNSLNKFNTASDRSTSFRKYDKASEDPFSSAKAFNLNREYQQNSDFQNNLGDVEDQLSTAQSSMMAIYNVVSMSSTGDTIQAITGTMPEDGRGTIAKKLRALQNGIVASANTKFADKYVFGGSGESEPPFAVGASGNLLYRGIDVNNGKIEAGTATTMNGAQIQFGKGTGTTYNGYTIKIADGGAGSSDAVSTTGTVITVSMDLASGKTNKDLLAALKGPGGLTGATMTGDLNVPLEAATPDSTVATDTIGQAGLEKLAKEQSFVDMGLGLKLNADNTINSQSVFDSAIPGISFMGYGTVDGTGTGISNNLYTLLGQISDQLESKTFSIEKIQPYLDSFKKQGDVLLNKVTESGTKSNFLTTTKKQLETMGDNVNDKLKNTMYDEPTDAYINFTWEQYCYQSALKIGSQILQPTFLDFMK